MKPQQLVTSLELSKRLDKLLKEKGVKVESLFSWVVGKSKPPFLDDTTTASVIIEIDDDEREVRPKLYSAFLSGELGELLPDNLGRPGTGLIVKKFSTHWTIRYFVEPLNLEYDNIVMQAETEAEARGLMLEYILKNDLLKEREK